MLTTTCETLRAPGNNILADKIEKSETVIFVTVIFPYLPPLTVEVGKNYFLHVLFTRQFQATCQISENSYSSNYAISFLFSCFGIRPSLQDGCTSSQDWLVNGLMTKTVLTFLMLLNMFSSGRSLISSTAIPAVSYASYIKKNHGGTGNNFVFFCVSAVTFDVLEFGKVVSFGFEEYIVISPEVPAGFSC